MERPAKTSLGIALWAGITVVACSCMPQTEPPPGPEAVPTPSNDDTLIRKVRPGAPRIEVMASDEQLLTSETTPVREGEATGGVDLVLDN